MPPLDAPTATMPPAAANQLVLLARDDADASLVSSFSALLTELGTENGLEFVTKSALSPADLATAKVVVVLPPAPELLSWAANAPAVQFIAVGVEGVPASGNISLIGGGQSSVQNQAFMAGYLTALLTEDYRAGVILASGMPDTATVADAFKAGARFYCGLCKPFYPPFISFPFFPVTSEVANAQDQASWQAAADAMISLDVTHVYIQPEAFSPALANYLMQNNVIIVSGVLPAADVDLSRWAGTLQYSPLEALRSLFPSVLAGNGGQQVPLSLTLLHGNAGLISDGRVRLFNETLDQLEQGLILPGSVP